VEKSKIIYKKLKESSVKVRGMNINQSSAPLPTDVKSERNNEKTANSHCYI
jgi:hypothetical protein